jgi:hypothetical protein
MSLFLVSMAVGIGIAICLIVYLSLLVWVLEWIYYVTGRYWVLGSGLFVFTLGPLLGILIYLSHYK